MGKKETLEVLLDYGSILHQDPLSYIKMNEALRHDPKGYNLWEALVSRELLTRSLIFDEENAKLILDFLSKKKKVSSAALTEARRVARKELKSEGIKATRGEVEKRALDYLLNKDIVSNKLASSVWEEKGHKRMMESLFKNKVPWYKFIPLSVDTKKAIYKRNGEGREAFKRAFEAGVKDLEGLRRAIKELQELTPVKVHTTGEDRAEVLSESIGADGFKLKFQNADGIHVDDFEWIGNPKDYFEWYKQHMKRDPVLPKVVIDWAEPPRKTDPVYNIEGKHITGKRRQEASDGVFKIWVHNLEKGKYEIRETGKSRTLTHMLTKVIKPRYLDGTFARYHHEATI